VAEKYILNTVSYVLVHGPYVYSCGVDERRNSCEAGNSRQRLPSQLTAPQSLVFRQVPLQASRSAASTGWPPMPRMPSNSFQQTVYSERYTAQRIN